MINPVKSFLTHGPLILKEIYTNKFQKYTHTVHTHTVHRHTVHTHTVQLTVRETVETRG